MSDSGLYRVEALSALRTKWLGDVVLVSSFSSVAITAIISSIVCLILSFAFFGSYTKRQAVLGELVPNVGILKIFPSQPGIVVEKHVSEGQEIRKGDVLYVISSERHGGEENASVQEAISRQVLLRHRSLSEELIQTRRLHRGEESALRGKIDGLIEERDNIIRQIIGQRVRVELSQEAVTRTAKLHDQGYISAELWQQKQADLLDQKNRLDALERDRISVTREIAGQRTELAALPIRHRTQIAQVERLIINADQEWAESEGKRQIAVIAPENGIATAVTAELGQTVDGARPMANVIPKDAILQAYLYAPSRAIGFVRVGSPVILRYQAYPYQKFGHAHGLVSAVSRMALSSGELNGLQNSNAVGEPLYRITVSLQSQKIKAYGESKNLQAGMLLDADILLEKRKLYEWVLEPLYSITGKL